LKRDGEVRQASYSIETIIVRFARSVNGISKSLAWNPTLIDRQPWDVREAAGRKTATDRIRAKLKKILARHIPPPLPKGAAAQIATILQEAEGAQFHMIGVRRTSNNKRRSTSS
jgi:hypothetical protein